MPALSLLLALAAAPTPLTMVYGESIAGVKIGMTRAEVEAKGHVLSPEGVERDHRIGFTSGPLLFLFDDATNTVVLISVELQRTGGLRVGKVNVPARISAVDFAKKVPGCRLEKGSGGNALSCTDGAGRTFNAYDAYGEKWVSSVHLGPG